MLKKKMLNLAADMVAQARIYGKANGKSSDTIYDLRGRVVGHDSSSVDLPKDEKAQERAHCCVAFLGIGVYVGAEALFLAFFLLLRLWLDNWLLHWRWP